MECLLTEVIKNENTRPYQSSDLSGRSLRGSPLQTYTIDHTSKSGDPGSGPVITVFPYWGPLLSVNLLAKAHSDALQENRWFLIAAMVRAGIPSNHLMEAVELHEDRFKYSD